MWAAEGWGCLTLFQTLCHLYSRVRGYLPGKKGCSSLGLQALDFFSWKYKTDLWSRQVEIIYKPTSCKTLTSVHVADGV